MILAIYALRHEGAYSLNSFYSSSDKLNMKKVLLLTLTLFTFVALSAPVAHAQFGDDDISADDTYDPFADFSEFEPSVDEEADIHYFKNGRFFNFAFLLGGRTWTQTLGELNSPSPIYGIYLTYFFDIRSALQISFIHGEHKFKVDSGIGPDGAYEGFTGNTSLSVISAEYKYYFNTANITRGFADLNPYLIGGFSLNQRTVSVTGESVLVKSSPTGVQGGFGLEIPIARNKMYMGAQLMYHYVNFPDESEAIYSFDAPTNIFPNGDYIQGLFVLGINF